MTDYDSITETECEYCEKFTSYYHDELECSAHYYVTHSDTDKELTKSERRRIFSKKKKLKTSCKKQRRRKEKDLIQYYCSTKK